MPSHGQIQGNRMQREIKLLDCPFDGNKGDVIFDNDHHGEWFNLGCCNKECVANNLFYTEEIENLDKSINEWNKRHKIEDLK